MTLRPAPKPQRPERGTAACHEHMALVAQLGCVICGSRPVELHHVSHGRFAQRKASDFDVIPLCPMHHRFRTERGETWAQMYGFDWEYLPAVRKQVKTLRRRSNRMTGARTYPAWICHDCGVAHGVGFGTRSSTYHVGDACGWCGRDDVAVTEPRDYKYPRAPMRPR